MYLNIVGSVRLSAAEEDLVKHLMKRLVVMVRRFRVRVEATEQSGIMVVWRSMIYRRGLIIHGLIEGEWEECTHEEAFSFSYTCSFNFIMAFLPSPTKPKVQCTSN